MKRDLTKTSFIIHYRKDHDDRFYNIKTILKFLNTFLDCKEIFIVNDDKELDQELLNESNQYENVRVIFFKNDDVYRRPFCFKKAASISSGEVLCFYDVDVLIKPEHLEISQNAICSRQLDHVYPYNGIFVNLLKIVRPDVEEYNFEKFESFVEGKTFPYNDEHIEICSPNSLGGVYLISKTAYAKMGEHDERFLGWGFEDDEFKKRSERYNKVGRLNDKDAICWHLSHDNTIRTENVYYQNNYNLAFGK